MKIAWERLDTHTELQSEDLIRTDIWKYLSIDYR
jgi:hypothetical protein